MCLVPSHRWLSPKLSRAPPRPPPPPLDISAGRAAHEEAGERRAVGKEGKKNYLGNKKKSLCYDIEQLVVNHYLLVATYFVR